jgi:hypothetical protein
VDETAWSPIARLKNGEGWLFFSRVRKYLNVFLPHNMEIVGRHKDTDKLVCYSPGVSWTIAFHELYLDKVPSPDQDRWQYGVSVKKYGTRFAVLVCQNNWDRGVIIDLEAAYPILNRTKNNYATIPWSKKGVMFETFSSVRQMIEWVCEITEVPSGFSNKISENIGVSVEEGRDSGRDPTSNSGGEGQNVVDES